MWPTWSSPVPKEQPRLDPGNPVHRFALELRRLWLRAGEPKVTELARSMYCSHSTVSAFLNGYRLPSPRQLDAFVRACHGDVAEWRAKLVEFRELMGLIDTTKHEIPNPYDTTQPKSYNWEKINEAQAVAAADERIYILENAHRESAAMRESLSQDNQGTPESDPPDTAVPASEDAEPAMLRVGIMGCVASGKTTYLAALDIAVARAAGDWSIAPLNAVSEEYLQRYTTKLAREKRLPEATMPGEMHDLSWALTGQESSQPVGGQTQAISHAIQLNLIDAAGEWYNAGNHTGFLGHIAACNGLLLQFDPRQSADGHNHSYLQLFLQALASRNSQERAQLPQYVAVCVTKFDEPAVFQEAVLGGHTSADGTAMSVPVVSSERAAAFFRDLCTRSGDAELFMALLNLYFQPDRIRYFVTSSLGFYISPETRKFDISDFRNVARTEYGQEVRGDIYPINVLEPILWLARSVAPGE